MSGTHTGAPSRRRTDHRRQTARRRENAARPGVRRGDPGSGGAGHDDRHHHRRVAVPALGSITVVTPDQVAADAAAQLGARVLTDPTPDGHARSAEQRDQRRRSGGDRESHRISLRCKVICPRCNPTNWPRRSPPPAPTRAASSATGTAPAPSALFAFGVPLDPLFGPDSARRHQQFGSDRTDRRVARACAATSTPPTTWWRPGDWAWVRQPSQAIGRPR